MHTKIGTGKRCWCAECKRAYHKLKSAEWEAAHRIERNARFKTPEGRAKARQKPSSLNQTERRREYQKKRYQDNKVKMRKTMDKWRADNLDTWNGYGRKRRAIMKGLLHEPYAGLEIYERDNGICGICKKDINIELKWPDVGSFSVDHIVPIALGGHDIPSNVQASHFGCNAGKAHRV